MSVTIKIGKLPGSVDEYSLPEGTSVLEAIEDYAELNVDGYSVKINGETYNIDDVEDDVVCNGDEIFLTKQIKGNTSVTVKIGYFPGVLKTVHLNGARTVADAIDGADLESSGYTIRVNDEVANMETILSDGDTIHLAKQIKGN